MDSNSEEIKKVVSIDVSQAVSDVEALSDSLKNVDSNILDNISTFKDYKKTIESLSVSLSKLDQNSEEYDNTLNDLTTVQDAYNEACKVSKSTTDAAAGSYNALAKEMSELKKAWRATNDESERSELGSKIAEINDKLKGFDESIGNYQRNVGNYASAFTEGLDQMGQKFADLNSPMKLAKTGVAALGNAFKALIANPIGAVIAAIVLTVKGLVNAFKSNEEASNKLKKAFSAFEPIINLIKKALGAVVNVIADLAVSFSKVTELFGKLANKYISFLNKIGILSDKRAEQIRGLIETQKKAVSESQGLADAEIELEKRKRKEMVETAKMEAQISELKLKATDTEKYSAKERATALEEAIKLERKINDERLAIAAEELRIVKARAEQTPNSKEDNEKLAETEANYYRVKKEYTEKAKELNSQLVNATKQAGVEIVESISDTTDALDAEAMKLQETLDKIGNDVLKGIDSDLDKTMQAEADEMIKSAENASAVMDRVRQREHESTTSSYEIRIEKLQEQYKRELELLEQNGEDTKLLTEQYQTDINKILAEKEQERQAKEEENSEKEDAELEEKRQKYIEFRTTVLDALGAVGDGWQSVLDAQLKTGKISEKEYKRRQKALQAFQIATVVAQSAASIFDLWAGFARETSTINNEGAEPAGMAAPVVKATLDAKSLISTVAKTAAIASTAAAQIAAIRSASSSSSVSSSSSGATASLSGSSTAVSANYNQTVLGSTDVKELQSAVSQGTSEGTAAGQQNLKVYVLESDITTAQNAVKTLVSESEF